MFRITALLILLICQISTYSFAAKEISAVDLYQAFDDNEIGAEAMFTDKSIHVVGKIKSIKKNIAGQPLVTLDAGALRFVSCRFQKSEMNQLINLKKGEQTGTTCTCGKKMITTVNMHDCSLD